MTNTEQHFMTMHKNIVGGYNIRLEHINMAGQERLFSIKHSQKSIRIPIQYVASIFLDQELTERYLSGLFSFSKEDLKILAEYIKQFGLEVPNFEYEVHSVDSIAKEIKKGQTYAVKFIEKLDEREYIKLLQAVQRDMASLSGTVVSKVEEKLNIKLLKGE